MKKLRNIHPGEILNKEFLGPWGITRYRLSKETCILQTKLQAIVKSRRRINPDIAAKLAGILGTLPNSGLNCSMILT